MKNIKLIRLLNGDTIITEILDASSDDYIEGLRVKRPVRVVLMPSTDSSKNPAVGFAPFVDFTEDEEIVLNLQHVLTMATPIDEFIKEYKKLFSNLITPDNGIILPK